MAKYCIGVAVYDFTDRPESATFVYYNDRTKVQYTSILAVPFEAYVIVEMNNIIEKQGVTLNGRPANVRMYTMGGNK